MPSRNRSIALIVAVLLAATACSGGGPDESQPSATASPTADNIPRVDVSDIGTDQDEEGCVIVERSVVHLAAAGDAFDATCISAAADEPFTILFTNADAGPHNVVIRQEDGTPLTATEPVTAGMITYAVEPLPAGTYVFACDIVPAMQGTLQVG